MTEPHSNMNVSGSRFSRIGLLGSVGLGIAVNALCLNARAQGVDEFGAYGRPQEELHYESPQAWAIELRIGPYYPRVDEEFAGAAHPLADTLGTGKRVLFGMEGDWQALRLGNVMNLGPGFGMAYTRLSGGATFRNAPDNTPAPDDVLAGGSTSPMDTNLKLWLQWAAAVARIDILDRRFRIPIVFTAKLGMGHAFWWAGKGNMASRDSAGVVGHGRSWGPMWALGAMFDLNFAQPERSRKLDSVSGINHMYLLFEWYQLKLNGFGGGDQMQVGDSTWALGYAVDF